MVLGEYTDHLASTDPMVSIDCYTSVTLLLIERSSIARYDRVFKTKLNENTNVSAVFQPVSQWPLGPASQSRNDFLQVNDNLHWVFPKYFHWIQWQKLLCFKKIIRTCHHLCERCYHGTSKTQVTKQIFKFSPIHASVIYQIPWIHWISDPFRENPIVINFTYMHIYH